MTLERTKSKDFLFACFLFCAFPDASMDEFFFLQDPFQPTNFANSDRE